MEAHEEAVRISLAAFITGAVGVVQYGRNMKACCINSLKRLLRYWIFKII